MKGKDEIIFHPKSGPYAKMAVITWDMPEGATIVNTTH